MTHILHKMTELTIHLATTCSGLQWPGSEPCMDLAEHKASQGPEKSHARGRVFSAAITAGA